MLAWHARLILRRWLDLLGLIIIHEGRIHNALSPRIEITKEHALVIISELASHCNSISITWWAWIDSCRRYHSMHILLTCITVAATLALCLHNYHRLLLFMPWFLTRSWILRRLLLLILGYTNQYELFWDVIFLNLIYQLMHSRLDIFIWKECWHFDVFDAYSIKICLFSLLLHCFSLFIGIPLGFDRFLPTFDLIHLSIRLTLIEKYGMSVVVPSCKYFRLRFSLSWGFSNLIIVEVFIFFICR